MYVLTPVEERGELVPRQHAATAHLSNCMYLVVFTAVYGLSFAMPFWSDESLTPVTTPTVHVTSVYTTASHSGDGTYRPRSFHDIWRFSWEYIGLAVRCLALVLLLCGSGVSLYRWCCVSLHHAPPPSVPTICGIVSGIMGAYAELVLWMGVILLSPNLALTQSQVFCSVTSIFCFLIGIVVYRTSRPNHHSVPGSHSVVQFEGPRSDDVESVVCLKRGDLNDFESPFSSSPDIPETRNVATNTEEASGFNAARRSPFEDDSRSDPIEGNDLCEKGTGAFTTYVCAEVCSREDLPDDLKRPTEEREQEDLPDDLKRPTEEREQEDLPDHLQSPSDKHSSNDHLDNLKNLVPPQRATCLADDLVRNGDFDHHTQFIDDDLYYHSSDDDQLERFIRHGSSPQDKQSVESVDSRSTTSASSTRRLIQTERPLLLPFCDSEEFHSLSDDDDSYKNKTWP